MRELIRPMLFAVVRLGLFLAAVVWIVSQWCELKIYKSVSARQQVRVTLW